MNSKPHRSIRRQDIRFKRSLLRFTLSFGLVLILGIASRIFIGNFPLKERVFESLSGLKNYSAEVGDVDLTFKDGWIPILGFEINRLVLRDSNCPARRFSGQDLLFKISLVSLIKGQITIGSLNLDFLEVDFLKVCSEKKGTEISSDPPKFVASQFETNVVNKIKNQNIALVFENYQKLLTRIPLKKLWVKKIQLNLLENLEKSFQMSGDLFLKLGSTSTGKFSIDKVEYQEKDFELNPSFLKFVLNPKVLNVELNTALREGKVLADFSVQNIEEFPTQLNIKTDKVPLSSLSNIIFADVGVSYLWATCEASVNSPWIHFMSHKLNFKECDVKGPYGNVVIKEIDASLERLNSYTIEIDKIILDEILRDKRDVLFSGVFSKYGVLSAQLVFREQEWTAQGYLENSEFIFSNNQLRDIQRVRKIPFSFFGNFNSWKAKINKVELDEGSFAGDLLLIGEGEQSLAKGRVAVHKIEMNPRIYKLMLKSKPTPLSVYGKFQVGKKGLDNWSAMVATTKVESELYEIHHLKIKGRGGVDGRAELKVSTGKGALGPESPLRSWIQPTYLEDLWSDSRKILFEELSTRITISKERSLSWERGYIRFNNNWQLSTEGKRDVEKNVTAWLQWDRPDKNFLRWSYQGVFFKGIWVPETSWLKNWLDSHSDYVKKNPSIEFVAAKKESISDKINKVGQKAIEKVKSVLRPEKKEKKN